MTDNRDESLEARRKRLAADLADLHAEDEAEAKREESVRESRKGMAQAVKLSSEFMSAIIVGAMLGYIVDRFAGTSPWGLIILLLLGFCAGILNVLRSVGAVAPPLSLKGRDDKDTGGKGDAP